MSAMSSFNILENKHHVYRGKDCMKKFCESLKEHAMKKVIFKKKKIKKLTNKQKKPYENAKIFYICTENWRIIILKIQILQQSYGPLS